MKIEELRVDNWVMNTLYHSPCKVIGISTDITIDFKDGARRYEALAEVEPIELTVETLDKNFNKSDRFKGFWELGGLYSITENSNYGFILCALDMDEFGGGYYVPAIPCTYFHELQNLLVDLRIDKKIEL